MTSYSSDRQARMKKAIIALLGGRCSSPTCHWVNDDGSIGCTDFRALQIDHVEGHGTNDIKAGGTAWYDRVLKFIKSDLTQTKYQLLCANCNWIKRSVKNENPGQ